MGDFPTLILLIMIFFSARSSDKNAEAIKILNPVSFATCTGSEGPLPSKIESIFAFISEVS